jgi:hypothetical protein
MSERETKWTPGPHAVVDGIDVANIGRRVVASGRVVAECAALSREENDANAHLFAAAEGMYDALEAVEWKGVQCFNQGDVTVAACPECGGLAPAEKRRTADMLHLLGVDRGFGHRPGCQLAAALASARGERPE